MTLTITVPRAGEQLVRLLLPLAGPCLVAAAGLAGLGPFGQAIFASALEAVRFEATWTVASDDASGTPALAVAAA
jgi:ABC-type maltose transport system permease subunit